MAEDKRGTKRQCEHCGMKYYDLNRDPILCPGCQEPYVEPAEPTPRRSKAPVDEPKPDEKTTSNEVEADPAAAEAGVETVSFEDAEKSDEDADSDDATTADEVTNDEEVEDIGGEVDNSFVVDEDDDGAQDNYGLNTAKDED